ncbi:hypothetical protein [uncultured Methanobrevibacter sp.]|uniref:hypothetical protein n=1 Tax=uncultured Methanobrevibacter sp. TaxID=253161 RepID=UPI002611237D|nr:hypothetical protein [uncultured Methanobrevibacter sp.]
MNMKRVLLIFLIAVAIVASISAVSAGLFDGLFGQAQDNVVELDNITFNTTNVTKFKLYNSSSEEGLDAKWYVDENESGYDVQIYNFSALDDSDYGEWVNEYLDYFGNLSSQNIDGVVVYDITADVGEHIGDARYVASFEDKDSKTIIDISTPYPDETAKIISTLKLK